MAVYLTKPMVLYKLVAPCVYANYKPPYCYQLSPNCYKFL